MGRANPIINSFVGGVLSPKLAGRTDIQQYYQSAEILINMIVECYGGAGSRPGLKFCSETKTSAKRSRLIPFVFSTVQAYMLEFGDLYIRFYKDYGQIISGSAAYELVSPYAEANLSSIQIAPTADVGYIVDGAHQMRKITRTGHAAWTITEIDYSTGTARPALMAQNEDLTKTITPSAATGTGITLTASVDLFDTSSPSLHIGSIWKIHEGWVKITAVTTAKIATGDVLYSISLGGTSAYSDWSEGAWSAKRGYPKTVTFNEQRLVAGGTDSQPQTVWESNLLAFETFDRGSNADDALDYTIATDQVEVLRWLFPGTKLAVGTEGGVHSFAAGNGSPVTPDNPPIVRRETSYRASSIIPKDIGGLVYYVQKYGRKLREFSYDLNSDRYAAGDASVFSEHITESGIVDMAYQQEPGNILWCVLANGKMVTFTRQIEQKVACWSGPHETDGFFESVAVIPGGSTEEHDQVWVIVRRLINGTWKRYVEYFAAPTLDDQEDAFFVDSGVGIDIPIVITGATQANPVVITTSTSHGLSNGDIVRIRGVEGMTEINKRYFKVANKTDTTFQITTVEGVNVDGRAYTTYVSDGEVRKCFRTLSGFSHLEGKTVKVCMDGGAHPPCVVTAGAITLNNYYSQGCAGLGFTPHFRSNDIEIAAGGGSTMGSQKRAVRAVIKFYRTLGARGGKGDNLNEINFRSTLDRMNCPPELFSGDKALTFPAGWDKEFKIDLVQDQPLPFHISAIKLEMEVN